MTGVALAQQRPLYGAAVALAAVALGSVILVEPEVALGLVGLMALVMLSLRVPAVVPVYLMVLSVGQPILVRYALGDDVLVNAVKRLDEASLAILLPLALARHLADRNWPLPRWSIAALLGLCALGIPGTVIEGTPWSIAALDAFLLFRGFVFFVILSAYPLGERAIRAIIGAAVVIALAILAIGLAELALPDLVRSVIPLDREGERLGFVALISIFKHEGQSGWFFAFFTTATYAFYLVYKRNAMLAFTIVFAACTVLTLRRKAIAGLIVMFAVAPLLDRRRGVRTRAALLAVALIGVGAVVFWNVMLGLIAQGFDAYVASRDPTRVARNAMYIVSYQVAVDHFPFGVGFGRFGGYTAQLYYSPVYFEYGVASLWGHGPRDPRFLLDTFWPHILGQFGFIGVPLFAWAMGAIWWPLVRLARERRTELVTALALVCSLTMVEALVESVALQVFEATLSSFFVFGVPALLYAHLRHRDGRPAAGSAA